MKLTVKPLKQKDAGRGLAAIDRAAMDEMDLENGDYIVLEGQSRAVARVWPGYPEDDSKGIVRIDGQLRQEAGVGIDDNVTVEKADVKPATSVTVALPQNLRVRGNVGPMIRNNLSGQAVTQGQTVPVSFGLGPLSSMSGQKIPLRIAETAPSGTVVVTDDEVVTGVFTDDGVTIGAISAETDDNVITDRSDRYEVQFNISTTGTDVMTGTIEGGDSIQVTLTTAPGASTVTELRVPDSLVDRNAVSL